VHLADVGEGRPALVGTDRIEVDHLRGGLRRRFVAKATTVAQARRALLEARAAEDEATAIRSQLRPATVEWAQPTIDAAAIYAARNQHCR
jgi:hypothetical protein